MSRRRKRILLFLVIIVFCVAVASRIAILAIDQPTTSTIKVGKVTQAGYSYNVNLTPTTQIGKTVSFNYPVGLVPQTQQPVGSPIVEQFSYQARDIESWLLAVSVSTLPAGDLTQNSAYSYRVANPKIYQASHETINNQAISLMTDKTADGFSQLAFITHGNLVATVSLTGNDASGSAPLKTAFNIVLQSWHWKQ